MKRLLLDTALLALVVGIIAEVYRCHAISVLAYCLSVLLLALAERKRD